MCSFIARNTLPHHLCPTAVEVVVGLFGTVVVVVAVSAIRLEHALNNRVTDNIIQLLNKIKLNKMPKGQRSLTWH